MRIPAVLAALAALAAGALGSRAKWHEDPRDDFVKNVYFTDKLSSWPAYGGAALKIETVGRYVYRLDATATNTDAGRPGHNQGLLQTVDVEGGAWYRLAVRGAGRQGNALVWAGNTGPGTLSEPGKQLPRGAAGTVTTDFFVPKGTAKVRVGVLMIGYKKGDSFSLSHVSLRKFDYSWLSNSSFRGGGAGGWAALNGASIAKKANTYRVTALVDGTDMSGPAGIRQAHVSVVPNRRYRIAARGFRAAGVKAMAFPRVYRSADNGFIAGPDSFAGASYSLPAGGKIGDVHYDFTVPEGVDRITVVVALVGSGALPNYRKGDVFEVESIVLVEVPNLLPNGDLSMGVAPWTANSATAVAASVDAGDRSLTGTLNTAIGTPGVRIDKFPVVPGTRYHFEALARTVSKATAYLWVQEPNGEDLHWVYKNGFAPSPTVSRHGIDFVAPRNVKVVNVGIFFASKPNKFAVGDKLIVHDVSITGFTAKDGFRAGEQIRELRGRAPQPPVRPTPPPPPPPVVIKPPSPAAPVAPPAWLSILDTKQSAALTDNVAPAIKNTYAVHPECRAAKMAWLAKVKPENVDACGSQCEAKFYGKGAAGDPTPYGDYRLCYECCVHMVEQYDGVAATGTAGKSWVPLSPKMFDSQSVLNFKMTYLVDEDGKVTIRGLSTAYGCGKGPGSGWVLFIKGDWTKIQYTQHFKGSASCNGVFGSMGYHYLPKGVSNGLLPFSARGGDRVYDAHRMGDLDTHAFDGRTTRCDNNKDNWWHTINGSGERRATANLRRDPAATRAGISTGVSCSHNALFEITDVYVWQ
jgi:hypothetical protein